MEKVLNFKGAISELAAQARLENPYITKQPGLFSKAAEVALKKSDDGDWAISPAELQAAQTILLEEWQKLKKITDGCREWKVPSAQCFKNYLTNYHPQTDQIVLPTLEEADFQTPMFASQDLAAIYFEADWCAPCKKLKPLLEEAASLYLGRVAVYHVDLDHCSAAFFDQWQAHELPLIVFMRKGTKIARLNRYDEIFSEDPKTPDKALTKMANRESLIQLFEQLKPSN